MKKLLLALLAVALCAGGCKEKPTVQEKAADTVALKAPGGETDEGAAMKGGETPSALGAELAAKPNTRGLAWKLSDGDNIVYLVGSIHVGKEGLYPMPARIMAAFAESKILVQELNVFEVEAPDSARKMAMTGMYGPTGNLGLHVSPETLALLDENEMVEALGPAAMHMKPWFLAVVISVQHLGKLGFDTKLGIDRHFAVLARDRKMPYETLETMDLQLGAFTGLSPKAQELFLRDTLERMPEAEKTITQALSVWQKGDAMALDDLLMKPMREPRFQEIFDALFVARNARMNEQILEYLATPETEFVVVGAGHFVGKGGLVETLRGDGRSVEQL